MSKPTQSRCSVKPGQDEARSLNGPTPSKSRYSVTLFWDEAGQVWIAEVPAMDGAATSGETVEEALAMAQELIEGRILVHRDYGETIPIEAVPAQLHSVEVPLAHSDAEARESTSASSKRG